MLPYTPLHHLLFADAPYDALVMTSGNLSEEPIVVSNDEALARLAGVADWFLLHNRDIYMRTDDSVVRTFEGRERLLRRSRGYAPEVMDLGRSVPELLACGGELKNVFCLTKGRHAILSQHIGDLENYETLVFFEETLANLKKLFRVEPRAVAHDLHPLYLSTKYALRLGLPTIGVQHHHAHLASCMLENGLDGETIGVCFDGTGYGTDGAIWGGEFLAGGYGGFERRAHLRYIPLAGGDAAVREPWRPALAYLMDTLGPDVPYDSHSLCADARGAADDPAGREHDPDLFLRAAVRRGRVDHRTAARGDVRRPGGDRTGNDRGGRRGRRFIPSRTTATISISGR